MQLVNEANTNAGYSGSTAPTQRLEETQPIDICMDTQSGIMESGQSVMTSGIETQVLKDLISNQLGNNEAVDSVMEDCMLGKCLIFTWREAFLIEIIIDLETQVTNFIEESETGSRPAIGLRNSSDEVNCACGVTVSPKIGIMHTIGSLINSQEDDGCVQCEDDCKRWFHLWSVCKYTPKKRC